MDRVLYKAAVSGNTMFLQTTEPDLDQVTPHHNTALHIASNFKQVEFSKKLLYYSPQLLLRVNSKGESALHVAARVGSFEIALLFLNTAAALQHDDVESRTISVLFSMENREKELALHVAVKNGHLEIARLLMREYPESLAFVNHANASPLYLAVDGQFTRIAHCIMEFSPLYSCAGPRGMTALHAAVIRHQPGKVQS
ncbi:hypothetical protein ACFE04_024661 [Oxalis oulophora]